MATEIQFADRALSDLAAIIDNFWLVSARAAEEFAEAHDLCIQNLMRFPRLGSRTGRSRLSVPIGRTGFRVVYRIREDAVTVLEIRNVRRAR